MHARAAFRFNGLTVCRDRRENGKGVARGAVKDNERCNDSVEEVDE